MSKNRKLIIVLISLSVLIAALPLFLLKGAEFSGSDDAGSQMISEITGTEYEPWFTPVLESMTGDELPGEVENLLFCVQTGIGVGIISFGFGYLVARKKYKPAEPPAVPHSSDD